MRNCKICNTKTKNGFNIDFKNVPVCEKCATKIFSQQATWLATKNLERIK